MTSPNILAVDDVRAVMSTIRQRRIDLGLEQKELATLADIHPATYHQHEKGGNFPSSRQLARLLRAVGLRLSAAEARP